MDKVLNPEIDYKASRVISSSLVFGNIKNRPNYGKVYYRTNEELLYPYSDIDFYEKDVLSVLSSGDHVFTARYLEAEKVDTFDINVLTLYYFYLRLWSIKYNYELFPDILHENHKWLRELLVRVRPKNEREMIIKNFYEKHMNDNTNFRYMFHEPTSQVTGKTTYKDASELQHYVDDEFDFYNIDIFNENNISNDYDIILLSNVLEWSHSDARKRQAIENLSKLTRKDGMVICSRLFSKTDLEKEKEMFDPYFEQENLGKTYVYHRK